MFEYVETTIEGKRFKLETGKYAKQADGSCLIRYGDTVLLATVVSSKEEPEEFLDFFPLTVNYQEKFYAVGKIPGGFIKREGKPSVEETLISRLIDRSIRPLFPKDYKQETQVIVTTLSSDQQSDPAVLGITAASCALMLSDIPFSGPIAGIRVGKINGKLKGFIPTNFIEESTLNLIIAGGWDTINMIESGSKMVSEDEMVEAIMFGKEKLKEVLSLEEELVEKAGKPKREYIPFDVSDELINRIDSMVALKLKEALSIVEKQKRNSKIDEIRKSVIDRVKEEYEDPNIELKAKLAFEDVLKELVRLKIISEGKRIDGRDLDDIRPIVCEVGILPRTHGSSTFTRGETQALVATTLGSKDDMQMIDDIEGERYERFMLHYNFPPFSTGEIKRLGAPGRREIGHGALAKRALEPVIPSEEEFPYAIRVVSDILESNGSSSMATVCGATLSLMDAGVPIKAPVSGVAMGLISAENEYFILTDILGDEDHYGDMDFKVAGTKEGITALQMDIKITGVTAEMLKVALDKAKKARMFILNKMLETIPEPRRELSKYAPKIAQLQINPDKIKDLIGPNGKTIKALIEQTGVKIDISPDGKVTVYGGMGSDMDKAVEIIKDLTTVIEENGIYEGVVSRIESYGAFVKLTSNQEGLLHISQISNERIRSVSDVLKVGDKIKVKVANIDKFGRISLSRKSLKD